MHRALITGIRGQDGSYLAEFLLGKGYEVHGIDLPRSEPHAGPCDEPVQCDEEGRLEYHDADLTDVERIPAILDKVNPDEVYNLAAFSHVGRSFEEPVKTMRINARAPLHLLQAIRERNHPPRFFQASSADMYGPGSPAPQNEDTPFNPVSPYACAKVYIHQITANLRTSANLFACSGILFNHESPRRPESFVTRKITRAAARIKLGLQEKLVLGSLEAKRDWGFAGDYVEAMWLILQHDEPGDYVIATGETHSVREFLDVVFRFHGLDPEKHVTFDPALVRPAEVDVKVGDATKARDVLGWKPKVGFEALAVMMAEYDLKQAMDAGR
ncbi:MAG: GDP-mannose 4,6-dehydratase [Planctomycetota bacterium]|jgi:GDPmannose 4,6-dehydratase